MSCRGVMPRKLLTNSRFYFGAITSRCSVTRADNPRVDRPPAAYMNGVPPPCDRPISLRAQRNRRKKGHPGWRDVPLAAAALGSRRCPTRPPVAAVQAQTSLSVPASRRSPNTLRCSGAPYGAQHLLRLTLVVFPPRRLASVEDRPKSSPKGCARDRARAHPAQGCSAQCPRRTLLRQWAQAAGMNSVALGAMPPSTKALSPREPAATVCAPPEANEDARHRHKPASLSGKNGFGDFPRKESHPGVQGAERPASSMSAGRSRHPCLSRHSCIHARRRRRHKPFREEYRSCARGSTSRGYRGTEYGRATCAPAA